VYSSYSYGAAYRKTVCKDFGFSAADRRENIRRLGAIADAFVQHNTIAIIVAINPFEDVRRELKIKIPGPYCMDLLCHGYPG
jgi:adenylylsulfate kinase